MTEFPPPDALPDPGGDPADLPGDQPSPAGDDPADVPADGPASGMVEATTTRLAQLDGTPVASHVAVYDELHANLQGALASLDEG